MSGIVADLGAVDRGRLAAHLAESRRLMTAPLELMDACMFRLPAEEVRIDTPLTRLADALIAAVEKPGLLELDAGQVGAQTAYVFSGWLERSADRASGRGWQDPGGDVADAISRIRLAWDARYGVKGDPGERSHWRTAAAYGRRRARRGWMAAAFTGGDAA